VHDGVQHSVRHHARALGWAAGGAGQASTAAALSALSVPATAGVAVPLSMGLSAVSAQAHVVLAAGADGSVTDAAAATAGAAGGLGLGVLGAVALGRGPLVRELVDGAGAAADTAAAVTEVTALRKGPSGRRAPGAAPGLDGGTVALTVHDVASPWHVGHGMQGGGFVGVAVVPVVSGTTGPGAAAPGSTPRPGGTAERDRAAARSR
jgi:hypothetical protein